MRTPVYTLLVGGFLLLFAAKGFAQESKANGQIEDAQIVIEKDKEIILPQREKVYFQADLNQFKLDPDDKKQLSFADIDVGLPRTAPTFPYKPFDFGQLSISKIYPIYARLGGGNYRNTYAEAFVSTKRAERHSAGVHLKHQAFGSGSVDGTNSSQSDNEVNVFGEYLFESVKVGGELMYKRTAGNFYGYGDQELGEDSLPFNYQEYGAKFVVLDRKGDDKVDYAAVLMPYHVQGSEELSETGFDLNAKTSYNLGETDKVNLEFDGLFLTYNSPGSSINRNLTGLKPTYEYRKDKLTVEAGFSAYFENDTSHLSKPFHLYPVLKASYMAMDKLELYAGLDGKMQRYGLRQAYQENPWLDTGAEFYHINQAIHLFGGAKTGLAKNLYALAELSYSSFENMPFYFNTGARNTRFLPLYDSSQVGLFQFRLGLDYAQLDQWHLWMKGGYNSYSVESLEQPWHKPQLELEAGARFWLKKKLALGAQVVFWHNLVGYDFEKQEKRELGAIIDVDLNAEYTISKHLGAFVRLDNLAAQTMERYSRYPSRGFQGQLGLSIAY